MSNARWISCADTAKLVRAELKKTFPKIKFTVRSSTYSMGASISVGWTDGPTENDVQAVVGKFSGSTFDGMIDLKSYHDSDLNGEKVHFGADAVMCSRSHSAELLRRRAARVAEKYGVELVEVKETKWGGVELVGGWERLGNYTVADKIYQEARKTRVV